MHGNTFFLFVCKEVCTGDHCSHTRLCCHCPLVRAVYHRYLWMSLQHGQPVLCVCVWMVGDTICCLACPSLLIQCQLRQPGSSFLCYKTSGDAVVLLGSAVHKSPHPILHQLCPMQVPEWCTCPMKVRERCVPSHMQLVYHTVRTKTANKLRNTVRSHRGVARKLGPAP